MVLSLLGQMNADIAQSIVRIDVHTLLATSFKNFAEFQVVQQQILWYFSMMLGWSKTYKAMHENSKVSLQFDSIHISLRFRSPSSLSSFFSYPLQSECWVLFFVMNTALIFRVFLLISCSSSS
jgi:hypothetical protein